MSERAYSNQRKPTGPLSQDNLGSRINERVVHHLEEDGLLTPAIPGSTT